jgi:hypothetical protein
MTDWLKRNWLLLIVGLVILFLAYGGIEGLIAKHNYKKSIKEKDIKIAELWGKIGDSKDREDKWKASAGKNWDLAQEKEKEIRKKDAEMRVKLAEKRALKKKIREMPVTQVIVRTIEIINCPDVVQQEQGVVFTLDCAKDNLVVLENVFYFKKEALDWADQFFTSQAEVVNLKDAIKDFNKAYKERGKQLDDAYGLSDEWEGKFNLSEERGKASEGKRSGGRV